MPRYYSSYRDHQRSANPRGGRGGYGQWSGFREEGSYQSRNQRREDGRMEGVDTFLDSQDGRPDPGDNPYREAPAPQMEGPFQSGYGNMEGPSFNQPELSVPMKRKKQFYGGAPNEVLGRMFEMRDKETDTRMRGENRGRALRNSYRKWRAANRKAPLEVRKAARQRYLDALGETKKSTKDEIYSGRRRGREKNKRRRRARKYSN